MAQLDNVRHEMFCRYLSQGQTQMDAYRHAGYEKSSANASVLAGKPFIKARVEELVREKMALEGYKTAGNLDSFDGAKEEIESTGTVRREWILKELVDNARLAREANQFAAANAALQLVGKEIGMFNEKAAPADDKKAVADTTKAIPVDKVNSLLDALGYKGAVDLKTMQPIKVTAKRLSKDKGDADA